MSGFNDGTLYASNVDFTGNAAPAPQMVSNGQLLIGSTLAPNIRVGSLTSSNSSVTITAGAGTIDLKAGNTVATTFTTGSGSAVPVAGVLSVTGGNGLSTTGAGNVVTVALPSAASTGTILRANGSAWVGTTATYPTTTTINRILFSSSASVIGEITTANNGVLITSAGGVPSLLAAGSTGQVLTATTGSPPSWGSASSLNSNGFFYVSTGATNVTGDGTVYIPLFDQTFFQNGTDISYNNGTGVFTCNTTGLYNIQWFINVSGFTSGTPLPTSFTGFLAQLKFPNHPGGGGYIMDNPGAHFNANTEGNASGGTLSHFISCLQPLTATETFNPTIKVSGANKVIGTAPTFGAPEDTLGNFFCYNRIT